MEEIFNSTSYSPTLKFQYNETNFNQTTDNDNNDESYEIARMVEVITRPIYVTIGTIGNLLSFYVMRRGSLKKVSTCFYMSILALADTGVLWSGAFVAWIGHLSRWTVNPDVWTDCKFGVFIYYFCCHYSSALLVMMNLENFFALYFPLKTKRICTVKTAKWVCSVAALFLIAFDAQFFFIYDIQTDTFGYEYCTFVGVPDKYLSIFYQIDSVIYSFAPFTIMCLVNSAIIYKFMRAKCRSREEGIESTNQALSKSATKGTAMLVTVSITFIILTAPVCFAYIITYSPSHLVKGIVITLYYLNHGINGILYCIVGSRFRSELKKALGCKTNRSSRKEGATTVTNISMSGNSRKNSTNTPTSSMDSNNIATNAPT